MKRTGPDSLESWIIACVCCFLNIVIFGLLRLSGMLFVASISRFQVTRDKAAFPYTLAYITRNSFGPLVGYLSQKFGVRTVTTIGCLVAAVGAGASFFAESIIAVTVLYGAVFGFGAGLGNLLLPVPINQYFDRHRATASGISYAGASLGSFVLAPITEFLLDNYGLSGTFLFISGFVLNCVPAALLLKKPKFDINKIPRNLQDHGNISHGTNIQDFAVEDGSKNPLIYLKDTKVMYNVSSPYEENKQNNKLECEESMKQLSAQTILSNCSRHMSTSEHLYLNQNLEKYKESRQEDLKALDLNTHCLPSQKLDTPADLDFKKEHIFKEKTLSSDVQYENPITASIFLKYRASLSEDDNSLKIKESGIDSFTDNRKNRYQNGTDHFKHGDITDRFSGNDEKNNGRKECSQSVKSSGIYLISYRRNIHLDDYKSQETLKSIPNEENISRSEWSEKDDPKLRNNKFTTPPVTFISKPEKISALRSLSVFFDPMFILIIITHATYGFSFVTMFTVIVDFSRDLQIGVANEQYVLMTLSAGSLVGRLSLGCITDSGFMSTKNFTAFCFAFQGVLTASIVWSNGFIMLMILATLYGLAEAGIIIIIPVLIAQYIDPDKQTMAVSCRNCIAGPMYFAVAPLIGYFRDTLGAYDFFLLGIGISLWICSFSWLFVPCIARCKRT